MQRVWVKWAGIVMLGAQVACSSGAEEPEAAATAGEEHAAYQGPIASQDVAAGQEIYLTFCDDCHPDGEADVGPNLIADPHPPAEIRQQVREGSGKMKAFDEGKISAEELEHLLAYLASIGAVTQ